MKSISDELDENQNEHCSFFKDLKCKKTRPVFDTNLRIFVVFLQFLCLSCIFLDALRFFLVVAGS